MTLHKAVIRWAREIIANWWKYSGEKGPVVTVGALVGRKTQLTLM